MEGLQDRNKKILRGREVLWRAAGLGVGSGNEDGSLTGWTRSYDIPPTCRLKKPRGKHHMVAMDTTERLSKMASVLAVDDFVTLYEPYI